jgi:hypothetical protein
MTKLPFLGEHQLDGSIFAGLTTRPDGVHCAVVLLPGKADDLNWKAAKAWAEEQGGELPSRPVAALLFANVSPSLSPEWHWTADEYSASGAWNCDFGYGRQHYDLRVTDLAAVAVRLVPVTTTFGDVK